MAKRTGKKTRADTKNRSVANQQAVFHALTEIKDNDTRNLLRGILGQNSGRVANAESINAIRKNAHFDDLDTAIVILLGAEGAFPLANVGGTCRNLLLTHKLAPISAERELGFLIGRLNGWVNEVATILGSISLLKELPVVDSQDAIGALSAFAARWGASNFLVKKLAFVMSSCGTDAAPSNEFASIAAIIEHERYPTPYFSALESIDVDFPYFSGTTGRLQVIKKYVDGEFRQLLPLHNIIGSPHAKDEIGPFLRKCHSMSLVDEVVGLLQILHFEDRWPWITQFIEQRLNPELRTTIGQFRNQLFNPFSLFNDSSPNDADLVYYRRSLAFVEFEQPAKYRDFVDRTIGPRLLAPLAPPSDAIVNSEKIPSRRDMTKALHGFRKPDDYQKVQNCGKFLRTVGFLKSIADQTNINSFTHFDIRYIFENTQSLDVLLNEREIENLYISVDEASRPLVTILALALHKAKMHTDDVDFKFRMSLSKIIIDKYQGSILSFINWLLDDTPNIANFLLSILDRETLQKMYWIVSSSSEADIIRQETLRAVGKKKGIIDYFVEADSIEAERQVKRLQQYFDDSRIYVDGISMKRWLLENPNAYSQQYVRLLERGVNTLTAYSIELQSDGSISANSNEIKIFAGYDYILLEILKVAFEQFCLNPNFGIESYLGRRIRHNTLTGMMRGGVESIIDKPAYNLLRFDHNFLEAHANWVTEYRSLIEIMRREYLQFKSKSQTGMFNSDIDGEDELTKTNIALLRAQSLAAKSAELLNDLIIRSCWRQIDPQLDRAAKEITSRFLPMANAAIERHFGQFDGDKRSQFKGELRDSVHARFTRLASWFRQPESGFVVASIRQLSDLIVLEVQPKENARPINWTGSAVDTLMDGLSVHRMYDCLSVVIQNALRYSVTDSPIMVSVGRQVTDKANIARLHVSVESMIGDDDPNESHADRLRRSFAEEDLSASMVREGYSGIKKLRFIIVNSEGKQTASYAIEGERCTISFYLTVEIAESQEVAA